MLNFSSIGLKTKTLDTNVWHAPWSEATNILKMTTWVIRAQLKFTIILFPN